MKTKPTHTPQSPTPTPWKLGISYEGKVKIYHEENNDDPQTITLDTSDANAAFIVLAVNFHQVLLNIAKNLHFAQHKEYDPDCETCDTIANAEGK